MNDVTAGYQQKITALVLAGGRGKRLSGQDKGLVTVNGKPLISHVLDKIRPQVGQILVCANRNFEQYLELGYDVITDTFAAEEYAGPLAGLLTGLSACQTEYLLVVPCDTPCLPTDLVSSLYQELEQSGMDIVTIHDGERLQQLIMLMRRSVGVNLHGWLEQGGRAVQDWLATHKYAVLNDVRSNAYKNLNTTGDIESFAQTLCAQDG